MSGAGMLEQLGFFRQCQEVALFSQHWLISGSMNSAKAGLSPTSAQTWSRRFHFLISTAFHLGKHDVGHVDTEFLAKSAEAGFS